MLPGYSTQYQVLSELGLCLVICDAVLINCVCCRVIWLSTKCYLRKGSVAALTVIQ